MHRRLRVNVVKNDCVVILPENFRWDLSCDDFFKNGHDVSGWSVGCCKSAQSDANSNAKAAAVSLGWPTFQRSEQSNRGESLAVVSLSRTKQTISWRSASQARVHVLTPRRCFTQDCSEQSRRLSAPVAIKPLIRFSRRSKNASS